MQVESSWFPPNLTAFWRIVRSDDDTVWHYFKNGAYMFSSETLTYTARKTEKGIMHACMDGYLFMPIVQKATPPQCDAPPVMPLL